ncbi:hypothetical protein [Clostridium sp.]|uniref:hypothetical protein n=1 Tax=Clostridium sp. TaxID=1506 RepID=UPI0025C367E6|nr:hypothetical protein [Clostridium sp.]
MLDMRTGVGEFLLTLKHPYKNTTITELWRLNIDLCKKNIEPLEITVKEVLEDNELPL